jgi:hypothetical protein
MRINDTGHAAGSDGAGRQNRADSLWPIHPTFEKPDFLIEFLGKFLTQWS